MFMKQLTQYFIVYTIKTVSYELNEIKWQLSMEKSKYFSDNAYPYFSDD